MNPRPSKNAHSESRDRTDLGSARVSRAGERVLAVANFLTATQPVKILALEKACFGATPKPARETRAFPRESPFNPWKQRHRFADDMPIGQSPPLCICQ